MKLHVQRQHTTRGVGHVHMICKVHTSTDPCSNLSCFFSHAVSFFELSCLNKQMASLCITCFMTLTATCSLGHRSKSDIDI